MKMHVPPSPVMRTATVRDRIPFCTSVEQRIVAFVAVALLAALIAPVAASFHLMGAVVVVLTCLAAFPSLLSADVRGRFAAGTAIAVAWVLHIGPPPLSNAADLLLGLIGQGIAITLGLGLLMRYPPADASAVRARRAQASVASAR